jgi:hypothetical protein
VLLEPGAQTVMLKLGSSGLVLPITYLDDWLFFLTLHSVIASGIPSGTYQCFSGSPAGTYILPYCDLFPVA